MTPCIDIEKLLAPIAQETPAGEDLRYEGTYDRIKEAGRSDDQLAQGEWRSEVKTADWKQVAALGAEALAHRSKDLQIAVWLAEALAHQHGYQGLADGLKLIHQLLDRYWDHMYPQVVDDDLDYRAGPLVMINEKLPQTVYETPLCDPKKGTGYSYFNWEESRTIGYGHGLDKEQQKQRQALIDQGKVSAEAFDAAVTAGSMAFYRDLTDQLQQARGELKILDQVVSEKFTADPPGFSKLGRAVEACLNRVQKIYRDKQKSEVVPEDPMAAASGKADPPGPVAPELVDLVEPPMNTARRTPDNAICDITAMEEEIWRLAAGELQQGALKQALDRLLAAAAVAPSIREKNRFLLLLAKLCLQAGRTDLARPIAEKIYALLESLQLEQWEHPAWIAEVTETLYRCLEKQGGDKSERVKELFEKLCTLNITRAAAYRP